ncbi:MAG: transporter substrate-binding domain-containing protein, partial [Bacillota bacterium]
MKRIILAMLVLALVFTVACGGEQTTSDQVQEEETTSEQKQEETTNWDQIQEEGKLTIGMSADYKPFEYTDDDGEIVGFDVDIAKAIGDQLGIEVEFVDTAFDGLIPGLKSEKYDLIMSAMTITEERAKAVDFTDQYFNAGQVVAVMADNNDIKGPEDLEGKKVGV